MLVEDKVDDKDEVQAAASKDASSDDCMAVIRKFASLRVGSVAIIRRNDLVFLCFVFGVGSSKRIR